MSHAAIDVQINIWGGVIDLSMTSVISTWMKNLNLINISLVIFIS